MNLMFLLLVAALIAVNVGGLRLFYSAFPRHSPIARIAFALGTVVLINAVSILAVRLTDLL